MKHELEGERSAPLQGASVPHVFFWFNVFIHTAAGTLFVARHTSSSWNSPHSQPRFFSPTATDKELMHRPIVAVNRQSQEGSVGVRGLGNMMFWNEVFQEICFDCLGEGLERLCPQARYTSQLALKTGKTEPMQGGLLSLFCAVAVVASAYGFVLAPTCVSSPSSLRSCFAGDAARLSCRTQHDGRGHRAMSMQKGFG